MRLAADCEACSSRLQLRLALGDYAPKLPHQELDGDFWDNSSLTPKLAVGIYSFGERSKIYYHLSPSIRAL